MSQVNALSLLIYQLVPSNQRQAWKDYTAKNAGWKQDGIDFQLAGGYSENSIVAPPVQAVGVPPLDFSSGIANDIYTFNERFENVVDESPGPWLPLWQNAPALAAMNSENANGLSLIGNEKGFEEALQHRKASLGLTSGADPTVFDPVTWIVTVLLQVWGRSANDNEPIGYLFYPIIDDHEESSPVVGVFSMFLHWGGLFVNLLPEDAVGVLAVFENTCNQKFTYRVDGSRARNLGLGDLHNPKYNGLVKSIDVTSFFNGRQNSTYSGVPLSDGFCAYSVSIYPSEETENKYKTNAPFLYTISVVMIFVFTTIIFIMYDLIVEFRQRLVMRNALKTGAIVSDLFPDAIRERLMKDASSKKTRGSKSHYTSKKGLIKSFLSDDLEESSEEQPLADLFPDATVMFADIANFTAWSSSRDPSQVFVLLQTVYQAFDRIAHKRKVFKVETVGDSYVAVTGLPEPQEDHVVIMARFAQECLFKFTELTKSLEITLGPDTGDLRMRFGIHTGPVTAGVLRGERSRFQLFGDTVNMASRMESSGTPNRIQVSKATALHLQGAGKTAWVNPRHDEVHIKGKGIVETFYITPDVRYAGSAVSSIPSMTDIAHPMKQVKSSSKRVVSKKMERLIRWNVEVLAGHLRKVLARRMATKGRKFRSHNLRYTQEDRDGRTCLEELDDVLSMPPFNPKIIAKEADPTTIKLDPRVLHQLEKYVQMIAKMYRDNPFHNFEHASHVTMSVDKLLGRIVAPDITIKDANAVDLHDYTHGITSDPLTQFTVVLSALIHDVDHCGVSNTQLAEENPILAQAYKNKSIAEQNSVDIAWEMLMADDMRELRECIYSDTEELYRFRQTFTKVVLATDIFDKELNDLRQQRWIMAFSEAPSTNKQEEINVKATIVIEHLIQASDVSHTMQHWHIYRKWNSRLFSELYKAYREGRMGSDPANSWYKGELGFFDNYIIPLAKKLKECGVFGVSSDEYLSYAIANREEWEHKGQQIVAEMVEQLQAATTPCQTNSVIEEIEEEDDDTAIDAAQV